MLELACAAFLLEGMKAEVKQTYADKVCAHFSRLDIALTST